MPAPTMLTASEEMPRPSRYRQALSAMSLTLAVVSGVLFARFASSLSDAATERHDTSHVVQAELAPGRPSPPDGMEEPVGIGTSTTRSTTTTSATTTTSTPSSATIPTVRREPGGRSSASGATGAGGATERQPPVPANPVPDGRRLRPGEQGPAVRELERRLAELGYWAGEPDRTYGEATRQAVLAFQKAEGLEDRDGVADAEVGERLAAASSGWGRSHRGTAIEIDRGRQLVMLVEDGAVRWTLNTATGTELRPGTFAVEREIDRRYETPTGTIHRPKYFDGSLALHGSGGEAPVRRLSGGASLSDEAMDLLWRGADVGTPVLVY